MSACLAFASPTAPPTRTTQSPLPRTTPACFPFPSWAELGPQRCQRPPRGHRQVEPSPNAWPPSLRGMRPACILSVQHSNLSPLRLPQSPWPTRTSARSASSSPTASSTRSSMRYEYAPQGQRGARAFFVARTHTQGSIRRGERTPSAGPVASCWLPDRA